LEIRRVREDEKHLALYLSSLAFLYGRRRTPWEDDPDQPDTVAFGVWDDRGYQAQAIVLSFAARMGPEVVMPMGGIAGVACMPAARGRGYVRAVMVRTLEHMREAGQTISTLFPFSFDFYRELGWEWVGVERRYSVSSQVLKSAQDTENCVQAGPEDRPRIVETYRRFSNGYRGMLERDEKLWNKRLDGSEEHHTCTFLYEGTSGVEGYLIYTGGSGECMDLSEFICLTPNALRGLLGLLRRLNMQTRRFAWSAPDDDQLWSVFCHHAVETRIAPVTQGRVVDLVGALQAWKPNAATEGRFTMQVADEHAPWNAGVWEVEFGGGSVRVLPARREAQLSLDIQALSQAFFGWPDAEALRRAGRLSVADEAGFEAFRTCLSGPIMWMNDSF